MSGNVVMRDERTLAVENASHRVGFLVLSYGLLAAVAYRAFVMHESSWDLMLLVVASGGATTAYQAVQRVLTRQWAVAAAITLLGAALVAVLVALVARVR